MIKNLHISLFEQGKIKIGKKGAKKRSGKGTEYREAVKLDYFIITTLERDSQDNFIVDAAAMEGLENEPKRLPIELLFDDIELNFPTCYAMYSQKDGLLCRGDGETAITAKQKNIVCNPDTCPHAQNKTCKPSGILSCRLPHLKTLGGVYKFRTHSWNSIKNILASLQYLATLTGGILAGLPLELRTEKKPTKFGLVNIVNIVFPGTQDALADALEKEISRRQRLQIDVKNIETIARKTGMTEDDDDPIDVAEEFFPLKEDGEYPSTAEMLEGWEPAGPDIGDGENMPFQADGVEDFLPPPQQFATQKQKDLLCKIVGSHVFTDEERLTVRGTTVAGANNLPVDTFDRWLKWLQSESKKRKAAEKAAKAEQEFPEMSDKDVQQGRATIIERISDENLLVDLLAEYDGYVTAQDWKNVQRMINEAWE